MPISSSSSISKAFHFTMCSRISILDSPIMSSSNYTSLAQKQMYNNSSTLRNLFPIHQNILSVVFYIRVILKNRVKGKTETFWIFLLFFPNARNRNTDRAGMSWNYFKYSRSFPFFLVWEDRTSGKFKINSAILLNYLP